MPVRSHRTAIYFSKPVLNRNYRAREQQRHKPLRAFHPARQMHDLLPRPLRHALGDHEAVAAAGVVLEAEKAGAGAGGDAEGFFHVAPCAFRLQVRGEDAAEGGPVVAPRRRASRGRRAKAAQADITDARLKKARGEDVLREARLAREGHGAHVDQGADPLLPQKRDEGICRDALVARGVYPFRPQLPAFRSRAISWWLLSAGRVSAAKDLRAGSLPSPA